MTTPLAERIEEVAPQARSVTVDGQQITRRSLTELIEADRYLAAQAAAARPSRILAFVPLVSRGVR